MARFTRRVVPCVVCSTASVILGWLYKDVLKIAALFGLVKRLLCRRRGQKGSNKAVPQLLSDRQLETVFTACASAGG